MTPVARSDRRIRLRQLDRGTYWPPLVSTLALRISTVWAFLDGYPQAYRRPVTNHGEELAGGPSGRAASAVPEAPAAGFTHRDPGQHGSGFAAGGAADVLAPGPVLAGLAEQATASGLDGWTTTNSPGCCARGGG